MGIAFNFLVLTGLYILKINNFNKRLTHFYYQDMVYTSLLTLSKYS